MGIKSIMNKKAFKIEDNLLISSLAICAANLFFLLVLITFFPSFHLFIISFVYLVVCLIIYKFIRFQEIKNLFIFHYMLINLPISIIYTLYLVIYFYSNKLLLLSLLTICIYILLIKYTKKRVRKKITIEIDDDGVKFAKFIFKKSKGVPKSLIIAIGIWTGTNKIELTTSIFSLFIITAYIFFILAVYYSFFENKYCIENELVYIYKGEEIDKYRFKDIG